MIQNHASIEIRTKWSHTNGFPFLFYFLFYFLFPLISTLPSPTSWARKWKCRRFDTIFVPGCTGRCHFDHFHNSQQQKFHQYDNTSISVNVYLETALMCKICTVRFVQKSCQPPWLTASILFPHILMKQNKLMTFRGSLQNQISL